MAVVIVHAGGRGVSDFACFGGSPPMCHRVFVFTISMLYSICVVVLW